MTIVGKILVFINLVFSVGVGLLVLFVYVTRTNYAVALKNESNYRKMEQSEIQAFKADREELLKRIQNEEARYKADHERVAKQLEDQHKVNQDLKKSWDDEKARASRLEAQIAAQKTEVERRQQDVDQMKATLKKEMDSNIKLVQEKNDLLQRTTAAEIQSRTVMDINARMEKQLQDMARDIAKYRSTIGPATAVNKTGKNPPSEDVDGLVKTVDPSGTLVTLTIGSDAGLVANHTLEVYRVNQVNPQQSRYLGTLRILSVSHKEAVAQPVGRLNGAIQVGDVVASRILGKG